MTTDEFRKQAHRLVDWMADYMDEVENYPVKSKTAPGEIMDQLPDKAPEEPEAFDRIFEDFRKIIVPGITHWQSPNFFAYFPANSSPPSVLAEMLTAVLGVQGMIWETSPAAAELEAQVMHWLREATGLPDEWEGVIQDTASTATLASLLTAREKHSSWQVNETGLRGKPVYRIYGSGETHSSIEKAVRIAGFGRENLVQVPVDEQLAMKPGELETRIRKDLESGYEPLAVVVTLGTTGTTAIDPLEPIAKIAAKHGLWLHVDAALAGTALLLKEYRYMIRGIEHADSLVFNPHKWMFTNFDCSAYFVRDAQALIRTFEILPEYLKTRTRGKVNDYRDWGIPLGRRFRALKLWFVLRTYGVQGIRTKILHHISLAKSLAEKVKVSDDFVLMAPVPLNTVCFRYRPDPQMAQKDQDTMNRKILERLNDSGRMFLTHTRVNGWYTLRMVTAQTHVCEEHVQNAWDLICDTARTVYG